MRNHGSISWSFLQQYMVPNVHRFRNKELKYDIKQHIYMVLFYWTWVLSLPCLASTWVTPSCITDFIDVTLADEDAFATQKFCCYCWYRRWPWGKHWQILSEGGQLVKNILTVWQQTTTTAESHRGVGQLVVCCTCLAVSLTKAPNSQRSTLPCLWQYFGCSSQFVVAKRKTLFTYR